MNIWRKARSSSKFYFDLIANEKLKVNFLQALPFWFASLLTGMAAVLYTRLFTMAEGYRRSITYAHPWLLFLLVPICFLIAWWVVIKFAPNAKGSGIPQVMASIELSNYKSGSVIDKLLNIRIIIVKIFSSLILVFGGGAIGREGPTIQIAGSIFRRVNKTIPASWPKLSNQSFILTGAAAGLAAAFNTPLGGIVFAVEELSKIHIRFFRTALFSAVIIAGLTAQGLLGPYLYLGYPDVNNLSLSIFIGVIITSIIAGLAGSIMSVLLLKLLKWKKRFKKTYQIAFFVLIAGLVIACVAYFINNKILGSGKEIMTTHLFTQDKYESWTTILARMGGTIIAFATGSAGGVFAPSLTAGATIGAYISGLFHVAGANANILILSGMVGFLTGVTRTPFTSSILVLEMTDRHNVIFHLMLAGLFSHLVSSLIDKHSFYDHLKNEYVADVKEPEPALPTQASS